MQMACEEEKKTFDEPRTTQPEKSPREAGKKGLICFYFPGIVAFMFCFHFDEMFCWKIVFLLASTALGCEHDEI